MDPFDLPEENNNVDLLGPDAAPGVDAVTGFSSKGLKDSRPGGAFGDTNGAGSRQERQVKTKFNETFRTSDNYQEMVRYQDGQMGLLITGKKGDKLDFAKHKYNPAGPAGAAIITDESGKQYCILTDNEGYTHFIDGNNKGKPVVTTFADFHPNLPSIQFGKPWEVQGQKINVQDIVLQYKTDRDNKLGATPMEGENSFKKYREILDSPLPSWDPPLAESGQPESTGNKAALAKVRGELAKLREAVKKQRLPDETAGSQTAQPGGVNEEAIRDLGDSAISLIPDEMISSEPLMLQFIADFRRYREDLFKNFAQEFLPSIPFDKLTDKDFIEIILKRREQRNQYLTPDNPPKIRSEGTQHEPKPQPNSQSPLPPQTPAAAVEAIGSGIAGGLTSPGVAEKFRRGLFEDNPGLFDREAANLGLSSKDELTDEQIAAIIRKTKRK